MRIPAGALALAVAGIAVEAASPALRHQHPWRGPAKAAATDAKSYNGPVRLIVDTDAGFDVDDVGAVGVANALQDNGECEIIAVAHTNGYNLAIGAVSSIMHFYDRDEVPLGAYKGPWAQDAHNPQAQGEQDRYVPDLDGNYPGPVKTYEQINATVPVYRKALAASPDGSVHIASIGITTNMRDLVQSQPDEYSPLNGTELIAQKVGLVVWMDGFYNFGCAEHDTQNWLGLDTDCRGSAKLAVAGWPSTVKQIFTTVGSDVLHGGWLQGCGLDGNPVRQAFEDWGVGGVGRSSWDPIAVMIAVRGAAGIHCKEEDVGEGYMTVDDAGHETWHPASGTMQSKIAYDGDGAQDKISFELNELLCKPPGAWGNSTQWVEAAGENCYGPRGTSPAHGATDLENPPDSSCGHMSVDLCKKKCMDLDGCTGITISKADANGEVDCYRKADVVLSGCDSGTDFSTVVRHDWLPARGFNCYPGHGASDLDPQSGCGTMSVRDCQAKCLELDGCTAVVWTGQDHSGLGTCFRKKDVVPAECDHGTSFDTYMHAGY